MSVLHLIKTLPVILELKHTDVKTHVAKYIRFYFVHFVQGTHTNHNGGNVFIFGLFNITFNMSDYYTEPNERKIKLWIRKDVEKTVVV
jgi:hypothetical protein